MSDTTTDYILRKVPHADHRAAVQRADAEGRTLRWVLLQALAEYGAGRWTPEPPLPARVRRATRQPA